MHEDFLQHIWAKQLFNSSSLTTTDGRSVHIVEPGTLSRTSGPDFRNAIVRIGEITFSGDIEFHRTFDDWNLHHHQNDPRYNSVILHVVLSGKAPDTPSQSGRIIPTIVLHPFLNSSIESIEDHLSREAYSSKTNALRCASINGGADAALLNGWIHTLFRERLKEKVLRLHDRLCSIILEQQRMTREPHPQYHETIGEIPLPNASIDKELLKQKFAWEQLLYEEVMDCFGYSNNRDPMKKLAGEITLMNLIPGAAGSELSPLQLEAILFKASGLLPSIHETSDQESKVHIHSLTSAWNEVPKKFSFSPIHPAEWIFSPTRPSNFPTIRIAGASMFLHSLLYRSLFRSLITTVDGKYSSPQSKIEQTAALFASGEHSFWNYHYSFSEPVPKKHALLGESRIFDIIVNAVVPFVCLYAHVFGKEDLFERCVSMAAELPLLDDNSILRTMNKHLIKNKIKIQFAYQQQGLIQLNKKYCAVERCGDCEVGKKIDQ